MADSPLKIAYLITDSGTGGAQRHLADLHAALAGRIDATVLAGGDGAMLREMEAAGARTIPIPLLDNSLAPLRSLRLLGQVVRTLHRLRPDLIHAHSAKAGAIARLAGLLLRIPVVYTVHGFAFKPEAPALQRLVAQAMESMLAPFTTRMICVSAAEHAMARRLPLSAARIATIPNGIPETAHRADPAAAVEHIVMAARFAPPKRPDLLIDAARRLQPTQAVEIIIAGDGPQLEIMRAYASDTPPLVSVSLPGAIDDMPALLAKAQIFVLLSDHEGFPLSVLEAMRAGLPVVASDLPGIREQLDHGNCGVLVPPRNPGAVAAALQALAADPARRAELGQAARRRYASHYRVGPMAELTWQIYLDTIQTRQRS
jgi:glycosyltransferase involved in cell wall biosynthesis